LDELGWPWPKHGCFVSETTNAWTRVLPAAATSLEKAEFCFALSLGQLKSHDGVVVILRHARKDLRLTSKYSSPWQWVVECPAERLQEISSLFNKFPVIVSFQESRLVTLDGLEFKIRKHLPQHNKWSDKWSGEISI